MGKAEIINEFRSRAFVNRDLTAIDEYLVDDFIDHFAPPEDPPGREGVRLRFGAAADGFHTEGVDVLLQFEDDELLCQVISIRMRHTGWFMGLEPTGALVRVGGFDTFRVRDGKLVEHWGTYDVSKLADLVGVDASWNVMWSSTDPESAGV